MIEWNRDADSFFQLLLVVVLLVLAVVKRQELGKGIYCFIAATTVVALNDALAFTMRLLNPEFNTIPFYVVAINLVVFLFYFIYFRKLLALYQSRVINLYLIVFFLITYLGFALFSEHFFSRFPYWFYCIEVVILVANIFLVLREAFNSDKVLDIKSYFPVWICTGLLIIYLDIVPLLIISNFGGGTMNNNIFFIILFIVNLLGYSLMLAGIFFAKNHRRA